MKIKPKDVKDIERVVVGLGTVVISLMRIWKRHTSKGAYFDSIEEGEALRDMSRRTTLQNGGTTPGFRAGAPSIDRRLR